MSCRIAEFPVPPRCRKLIRAGALVAINHSGGKDSQAMTILLSRIVPHCRLVAERRIGHTLSPSGRPLPELTGVSPATARHNDPAGLDRA